MLSFLKSFSKLDKKITCKNIGDLMTFEVKLHFMKNSHLYILALIKSFDKIISSKKYIRKSDFF